MHWHYIGLLYLKCIDTQASWSTWLQRAELNVKRKCFKVFLFIFPYCPPNIIISSMSFYIDIVILILSMSIKPSALACKLVVFVFILMFSFLNIIQYIHHDLAKLAWLGWVKNSQFTSTNPHLYFLLCPGKPSTSSAAVWPGCLSTEWVQPRHSGRTWN